MKRSILLSVMFIAGIIGVLGFSAAQFVDFETSSSDLTAGTIDLTVEGENAPFSCTLGPIGESGTADPCEFTLQNVGSLSGELWITVSSTPLACDDAGANDGTEHCDTTANISSSNVVVTAASQFGVNTGFPLPWSVFEGLGCYAYATAGVPIEIPANGTIDVSHIYQFTGLNNDAQGDAITLTFNFTLVEFGQGDDTSCLTSDPV